MTQITSSSDTPVSLRKHEFLVLIPEGIDIDFLCEKGRQSIKGFNPVKLLYFISLVSINTVQYYRKSLDEYQTRSHAAIDSGVLINTVGKDYKRYFELLYKHNVFTVRSPYSVSEKTPFGYGFHSNYRFSRFRLELLEDASMSKKFMSKFNKSSTRTYEKIFWSRYGKEKFSLDFNVAEKRLFEHYLFDVNFPLVEFDKANQQLTTVEPLKLKKFAAYQGALKQLVKFLNGQYNFSRKSSPLQRRGLPVAYKPMGRFYNPISTMNKIIREMLYYQGEKLVQLDVKNCLPYLLSNYLANHSRFTKGRYNRLKECPLFRSKYDQKINSSLEYVPFMRTFVPLSGCHASLVELNASYPNNYFSKVDPDSHCKLKAKYNYRHRRRFNVISTESHSLSNDNVWYESKFSSVSLLKKGNYSTLSLMGKLTNSLYPSPITFLGTSDNLAQLNQVINLTEKFVSSSQSFGDPRQFSSNFVGIKLPESKESVFEFNSKTIEGLAYRKPTSLVKVSPLFNKSYETVGTLFNKELEEFKKVCISGRMYEQLIPGIKALYKKVEWSELYERHHKAKYLNITEHDRAITKRLFIAMLYAKNKQYKNVQEAFRSKYPIIYDILFATKKRGYKRLTNKLFIVEADLLVDTIARKLIKEQKCDTFTIHDCIAVVESKKKIAEDMMRKVFMDRFGNMPEIEVE